MKLCLRTPASGVTFHAGEICEKECRRGSDKKVLASEKESSYSSYNLLKRVQILLGLVCMADLIEKKNKLNKQKNRKTKQIDKRN